MGRRVHGEGPIPCPLMAIGECPGWEEAKASRPFVGKTGKELDRYLDGVNLPARREVFLTNLYREYGGKDYEYTREDLQRDEPDLLAELARVGPTTIVTLGRHATRYFLGDVDIETVQGIPWIVSDSPTVIFPIVHPAAGLHQPEMASYVRSGFQELSRFLAGTLDARPFGIDPYPEPQYCLLEGDQVWEALKEL